MIQLVFIISLLTWIATYLIAASVNCACNPVPKTWIDVDMEVERKPLWRHVADCGLIYPAISAYLWTGLYLFITNSTVCANG